MTKLYYHLSEAVKIKKISDDGKAGFFTLKGFTPALA